MVSGFKTGYGDEDIYTIPDLKTYINLERICRIFKNIQAG
jgi:hypothetical protein